VSNGYNFQNGMITFEFVNPLYWEADRLAFGIETNMDNTFIFRAYSARNNKTIVVEMVNVYDF
jgi:hypothetical protein